MYCLGGHNVIGGMEENDNVVDKSEIYRYIKDNDLHRSPREHAFNVVSQQFNNPLIKVGISP